MIKNWSAYWKELCKVQPRPERAGKTDWYKRVPVDSVEANCAWRLDLIKKCQADPQLADAVRKACRDDFLFYVRAFGMLIESRKNKGDAKIPFVPWAKQEEILWKLDDAFGNRNVLVDKSRDMGASWMALYKIDHATRFFKDVDVGLLSKDIDSVDDPGNKDSLLPKMDLIHHGLPSFLKYKRERSFGKLLNVWTGSSIISDAPTENAFRGGRKRCILWDEMAHCREGVDTEIYNSLLRVTDSLLMISTLKKNRGEYYNLRLACINDPEPPAEMLIIEWLNIEHRRKNLYTSENGVLVKIDPNFNLPKDYPYILDGWIRSPYFDREWHRARGNAKFMAREFNRDIRGLSDEFFDEQQLKPLMQNNCVEPMNRYVIQATKHKDEPVRLQRNSNGPLAIWGYLDSQDRPPVGRYAIGCDLSSGVGTALTSNSVAHVVNCKTGEQVAEYVTNSERPGRFARRVRALAKMYHDAVINWESNGAYATRFKDELTQKLRYSRIWKHVDNSGTAAKKTKKPGWYNAKEGKEDLFTAWVDDLYSGKHIVRSTQLMREIKNYVYKGGKVVYAGTSDDTEADIGTAHGDRVIAAAIAWMVVQSRNWDSLDDDEIHVRRRIQYLGVAGIPLLQFEMNVGAGNSILDPW